MNYIQPRYLNYVRHFDIYDYDGDWSQDKNNYHRLKAGDELELVRKQEASTVSTRGFTISIQVPKGKSPFLEVGFGDKVTQLKSKIFWKTGIRAARQALIYGYKFLEDRFSLD